jgi:hypothetical protein
MLVQLRGYYMGGRSRAGVLTFEEKLQTSTLENTSQNNYRNMVINAYVVLVLRHGHAIERELTD